MAGKSLGWMHDEMYLRHESWMEKLAEARKSENWDAVQWVREDIRLFDQNEETGRKRLKALIGEIKET
jgi:hypothetical protein